MTTEQLDHLEILAAQTTVGTWCVITKGNTVQSHAIESIAGKVCSGISPRTRNAEFIVAAHEAVPQLIAALKATTEERDRAVAGLFVLRHSAATGSPIDADGIELMIGAVKVEGSRTNG